LTVTTKRGPRESVGRAHAAEPSSAATCTTMKSSMISVNEKPSVLDANTPAKVTTVFTPSSETRYAVRKRRICARAGSRRISRSVVSVSPTPRAAAVASRSGWRASAGRITKEGIAKTAKSTAAATKQPPVRAGRRERVGGREGHERARVTDRESRRRHAADALGRRDARQVGVVVDERGLVGHDAHPGQRPTPGSHAVADGGHQGGDDDAGDTEADGERLARAGVIGHAAERR